MGDPLQGIVMDNGEMIAGGDFLAREHDIAPGGGISLYALCGAAADFLPDHGFADFSYGTGHIEPPRHRATLHAPVAARAGVNRRTIGIARPWGINLPRCNRSGNIAARTPARIDQAALPQCFEASRIIRKMLRLTPHRLFPAQSQPIQILCDAVDKRLARPAGINILDAQKETPAISLRRVEIQKGRKRVAEMKMPIRRWCKSKNRFSGHAPLYPAPGILKTCAMSLIETDDDITRAVRALSRRCAVMRFMTKKTGPIPLRRRAGGFEGLVAIIVAQQVSVAAANAIWKKFTGIIHPLTPETFLAASDDMLAQTGLSRPKQRTIRAISEAVHGGALPLHDLHTRDPADIHALLTAVKGIGPWTADIYAMFCLGHGDAFAPGDLALQEAARIAYDLEERPSSLELAAIAEAWRPHRAVAARILWAYYAVAKQREGVVGKN